MGKLIAGFFQAIVPDPFVLAILLTVVTFGLGMFVEDRTAGQMLQYWQGPSGFWRLLGFGMQMVLILMTGHALASAPPVKRILNRVAELPRTAGQAIALTSFIAIWLGLFNWGLGLCAGALLAREVGRAMERKGIKVHYPLLAAAGYTSMTVWHGGFSGSAPLKVTGLADLKETLGDDLAARVGAIPLEQTILSPLNIFTTLGLLILIPLFMAQFSSKNRDRIQPISRFNVQPDSAMPDDGPGKTFFDRIQRTRVTTWLLAAPLFAYLAIYFAENGISNINLNTVNVLFLALGLALHGAPHHYVCACENAIRPCSNIVLQFPLYAGIMGMMAGSGLAATISDAFAQNSTAASLPIYTFFSSAFVNLFVPSGGGQWAIQGQIALDAALQVNADAGRVVMAFAYGDGLTNTIQPFWALPLLAIMGIRARDIIGYMAIVMLAAAVWICGCLLLF